MDGHEREKKAFTPLQTLIARSKPRRFVTGFTLVEILVAIIILVILASLSIPDFTKPKQAALDKRAKTGLLLVSAAEKVYYLKEGFFYPYDGSADITSINQFLRLNLSDDNWAYSVLNGGLTTFTATASQDSGRAFEIRNWDEEAEKKND